ncbi:astacin [Cooperia oncophora]
MRILILTLLVAMCVSAGFIDLKPGSLKILIKEKVKKTMDRIKQVGTAAHEIGHALGFFHTHSRHDRDKYITVDKENIKPDWLDQFLLETPETNNNYDLTYDYGSLMHYGTTSATRNEKPTMVPTLDARYGETLGSPFISFYDLLMLNKYYNCTDACKGTKTVCQNEGFPNPRRCSECICPSGYGGKLCEKK